MTTREHIQELTDTFVERYEQEVEDFPGFAPAARCLQAARSLRQAVSGDFSQVDTVDLMRVLASVKDSGTAGFAMWNCGQQWIAQNTPSVPSAKH